MRLGGDHLSHYELGDEENAPHYRVSFWKGTEEWYFEVHDADVDEVLTWTREQARGRHFTIHARIRPENDKGDPIDVRLFGVDPTCDDSDFPAWAVRGGPPTFVTGTATVTATDEPDNAE